MGPSLLFAGFVINHTDRCGGDRVTWSHSDQGFSVLCTACHDARPLTAEVITDTVEQAGTEIAVLFSSYEGRDRWLQALKNATARHNATAYRHILEDE